MLSSPLSPSITTPENSPKVSQENEKYLKIVAFVINISAVLVLSHISTLLFGYWGIGH
jgi:hypothetical protein